MNAESAVSRASDRLDRVAEILARGILRLLAAGGVASAPSGDSPAVTSAGGTSQEKGVDVRGRNSLAFVSAESVHVRAAAPIGLSG